MMQYNNFSTIPVKSLVLGSQGKGKNPAAVLCARALALHFAAPSPQHLWVPGIKRSLYQGGMWKDLRSRLEREGLQPVRSLNVLMRIIPAENSF